ncbi:unknown [Mycoplasma sp. CAG:956]|nr:unknown [Mycoplasma sp. CAG:956]
MTSGNRLIDADGGSPNFSLVDVDIGVKPIINLKANSLTKVLGTKDSLYTVE